MGSRYEAISEYREKDILKQAGFRWDPDRRRWWTSDPLIAAKLRQYADAATRAQLDAIMAEREAAIAASRATSADIDIPSPEGRTYLPFQRAGIAYALARPVTLIADEMGLGKTIQALGVINADPSIKSVLVVCPAAVKLNWAREAERWLVRPFRVGIVRGSDVPDADILIVNWELLDRLPNREWDLVVLDEAHYAKNPKAKRTQLALALKGRRRLALTGTPILNRPIELWPLLHAWLPNEWRNWRHYVTRYCDGYQGAYGWVVDGASHLDELQEKLRATLMIRRRKADVLTELPPKVRQLIVLDAPELAPLVARERASWDKHEATLAELRAEADAALDDEERYRAAVKKLADAARVAFEEMSAIRHELALAKVPYVVGHLQDVGHPVVVFAHHRDVAAKIAEATRGLLVTGDQTAEERQAAVDAFQAGKADVFVATIGAAGVGITLTRASHVVFAELDWVPAKITQAEDRCHRIGQHDSVLVQHLVVDGSLDARLAQTIVAKQEIIDKALDAPVDEQDIVVPDALPVRREDLAEPLPPEVARAAHDAVRYLAGLDRDYASARNAAGFSKYDSALGHKLAELPHLTAGQARLARKLALRYARQLPVQLMEVLR
jgi:SWI/SNF-related matrix-associated actin-dependent regulator 1 of chromatin subfamily A